MIVVDITLAWLDPFFSLVVDLLIGYFLLKIVLVDITLAWLDPNCSKIPTSPSPLLSQFHPTKALDPTSSQQREGNKGNLFFGFIFKAQ